MDIDIDIGVDIDVDMDIDIDRVEVWEKASKKFQTACGTLRSTSLSSPQHASPATPALLSAKARVMQRSYPQTAT